MEHVRHKPPSPLRQPRELLLVCAPLRSQVNLSRIVRMAGCAGLTRIIVCGSARVDREITRDALEVVQLEERRSLEPLLPRLRSEGYQLVGLEQASRSESLYGFGFERRTALIVGNERQGLDDQVLAQLDRVVEIPVYGRPFAHNVATATAMAVYEYCRQFPEG